MIRPISFFRVWLAGLIMGVMPFIAIANHLYIQSQDEKFEIIAQFSMRAGTDLYEITSELNHLSLSELSGADEFKRGETVFVHMAKGPEAIAYPFALTTHSAKAFDENAFTLKAVIVEADTETVNLRYNFEKFLPSRDLKQRLSQKISLPTKIELAVNSHSVPRLSAVIVDGQKFAHQVIDESFLDVLYQR